MSEPVKDYVTQANFVEYDATGAITCGGHQGIAFTTDAMARGERMLLTGVEFKPDTVCSTHYVEVSLKQIRERAACPAALDGMVLGRLPVPCRIEISTPFAAPTLYEWTDAALTLSFEHPGRYTVRVLSVPYLTGSFEVAFDG